jgi:chromate transporter
MGVTTASRVPRRLLPLLFLIGTFVAVGILRLPLVWVVIVGGGLSVLAEYLKLRKA